jgi:hypothetical protein
LALRPPGILAGLPDIAADGGAPVLFLVLDRRSSAFVKGMGGCAGRQA